MVKHKHGSAPIVVYYCSITINVLQLLLLWIMLEQTWDVEGFEELLGVFCDDDSLLFLEKWYNYFTACNIHNAVSMFIYL